MSKELIGWSELIPRPGIFRANRDNFSVHPYNSDDLLFEYEERCAILEFDAGFNRSKAEAVASLMVNVPE